ncbi:Transcriptional regulator [Luteimonas sp. 9C]|uniref:winged helix-turn-helix transcriptional regulator n=1 Tax=Luteimonas sp. 9C TaxID=2653148 RepID=UPI0012F04A27|nr:helix-turn-helix domain-containing protein [Luteimonas sp. 9C]VXB07477.1 Transcriptional regulator [Luteimonas sp. 9C]
MGKSYTPATAAADVETVFKRLGGRWKLLILFHLFGGQVQRYSDLERLMPGISPKMLAQQLRQLEHDGIVARQVYPEVPPKVEYRLTDWGQALCPALDALLQWDAARDAAATIDTPDVTRAVRASAVR